MRQPAHDRRAVNVYVGSALQRLAAYDRTAAPPYDFDEFQRRAAASRSPHRFTPPVWLRVAAALLPLGLLALIAIVSREDGATPSRATVALAIVQPENTRDAEPALVHVGPTVARAELEDRIAWFDSLLSEAPTVGLSERERESLRFGRNALADSLQRVRYADALASY